MFVASVQPRDLLSESAVSPRRTEECTRGARETVRDARERKSGREAEEEKSRGENEGGRDGGRGVRGRREMDHGSNSTAQRGPEGRIKGEVPPRLME